MPPPSHLMTLQGQSDSGRGSSMLSSGEESGRQPNSQQVSWKRFIVNSTGGKRGIDNYSQLEWGAPQLCIFSRYLGPLRPGNCLADSTSQPGLEPLNISQAGAGALPLAPRMAGFSSQELRLPPAAMLLSLSGTESGTFEKRQKD